MKKFTFVLLVAALLGGCKNKPSCELTDRYAGTAATRIAALFECKNPDAIKQDIIYQIDKLELCTKPVETGTIAALICKPAAAVVTKLIVGTALPKRWECTGGVPAQGLETAIYTACAALPF